MCGRVGRAVAQSWLNGLVSLPVLLLLLLSLQLPAVL
jgi:hypothetical protein